MHRDQVQPLDLRVYAILFLEMIQYGLSKRENIEIIIYILTIKDINSSQPKYILALMHYNFNVYYLINFRHIKSFIRKMRHTIINILLNFVGTVIPKEVTHLFRLFNLKENILFLLTRNFSFLFSS